jgi:hypothetical protein
MRILKLWYWRLLLSLVVGQIVVQLFEGFNDYIFFGTITICFIILSAMAKKL